MKVFYRPEQTVADVHSVSPSAGKPAKVVADWLAKGLIAPGDVCSFEPVSRADLVRVHDPVFVDGVMGLEIENGFNNCSAKVAASLPFTSGSLLAAARHAVVHQENVCSPTSGFHHAGHDFAGGFCTFNGLMVAAAALLASGEVGSVGILDCDVHYGDGTHDILSRMALSGVRHHTMGRAFRERADTGAGASRFLAWLDAALADCSDVDLLIYQAGADPHINDPLGGLLDGVALAKRDHAVFKAFQGRPLVWSLAGGYQRDLNGGIEPVLKIHRTTAVIQNIYQA